MRDRFGFLLVSAALLIAGCGGSTSTPPPTAPTVTSATPTSGATGVAVSSTVTATFSEAMTASSISSSTFTLTQGGNAVAGTVTYNSSSNTATFTPTANLAYGTQYTATITTGATASNGATLASSDSWSFTTAAAPAPTVASVTPTDTSTGVSITAPNITATFSTNMNTASITSTTFTLTGPSNTSIQGTVTPSSATTFAFTPNASLAYGTTYTATITTGAQSTLGAALAANYTWSFTTAPQPPPAPTITATVPVNASTGVAINSTVTVTFSEAMNASTLTSSTFTLTPQGGSAVAGTVTYNSGTMTATFTPSAPLSYKTMYFVALSPSIMATNGASLQGQGWDFTTAAQAPTVTSVTPTNALTSVAISSTVTATFSLAMDNTTLTASTFTLTSSGGAVTGAVSYNSGTMTATFTPSANLAYDTTYTATITTGAKTTDGGALASNYTWSFTTAGQFSDAVDFGTTFQTIRGFGGASVWLGPMPSAVATALFSPTQGLGLSILRVRIDPTGSPTTANPYETGDWDYEAANGAAAVQNNPNAIVFASPWTPPAVWKLNGSSSVTDDGVTVNQSFSTSCDRGAGYCGGYLDPNHYADYADYLEDFVSFWNTTNNFNLYAISMQNEPDAHTNYESCNWTPTEMDTWVAGYASTITSDPYNTKFIMPESESFTAPFTSKTLNDTNAEGQVSIVGGHIYQVLFGGTIAPVSIPGGDSPKEIWMTEFGELNNLPITWPAPNPANAGTDVMTYAKAIHDSLVTGQYNAYVSWGLFGTSTGSCATAAGTCGLVDHAGNVMPLGYVFGQYSKFIQPGTSVRVSATATPVAGVLVSAYHNTGNNASYPYQYVIVATNTNSTSESLTFTVNNGNVTSVTPYQSSATAGLAAQPAVPVTNGQFTYTLPARSITTFVQ